MDSSSTKAEACVQRILLVSALTLIVSLVVHISVALHYVSIMGVLTTDPTGLPPDAPRFPITLSPATMTTVLSNQYALNSDEAWDALMPVGDGFIRSEGGNRQFYLVSMFHQIHCLNNFRRYLANPHTLTALEGGHVDHCLRYMQQMVLCHADDALEPTHPFKMPNGKWTSLVTGMNVTHQCKDWEQLRRYAEDNYETWSL